MVDKLRERKQDFFFNNDNNNIINKQFSNFANWNSNFPILSTTDLLKLLLVYFSQDNIFLHINENLDQSYSQ